MPACPVRAQSIAYRTNTAKPDALSDAGNRRPVRFAGLRHRSWKIPGFKRFHRFTGWDQFFIGTNIRFLKKSPNCAF